MGPHAVKLFVSDVDGVLTDGRVVLDAEGVETKTFHVDDGTAVVLLRLAGIETALLSGRRSKPVELRARELKIAEVQLGVQRKAEALEAICDRLEVRLDEVAYMGDDLIDLPPLRMAGFAIVPANAHRLCRHEAQLVTARRGGEGAFREAAEFVLRARGLFDSALSAYLGERPERAGP